jgi:hypothetical protein
MNRYKNHLIAAAVLRVLAVLVVTAVAGLLSPVVLRASHPPIFPASLAQTAQPGTKGYQFTTIDAPGTSDTEAYGINNPGVVPGFYVVQGRAHGFVWRNGSLITVDHPDARNTLLGGVN